MEKKGIARLEIYAHWRDAHEPGETLDRLKDFPGLGHLCIADSLSRQDPRMWEAIGRIERLETLKATIR